jgi:AcrR family transcriptional regulator
MIYHEEMVEVAGTEAPRRRYNSARRRREARQTRLAILDAAHTQFLQCGWHGAGMRDIAAAAGVAVETVYSYFPSKAALLKEVINVGVVGDDEAIPLSERAEFRAVTVGPLRERIDALGRLAAAIGARIARLRLILREAARFDDDLAEIERMACAEEREQARVALQTFIPDPTDRDVEGLQAIFSNDVYVLLTDVRGWTPEQYAEWISETTEALLKAKGVNP